MSRFLFHITLMMYCNDKNTKDLFLARFCEVQFHTDKSNEKYPLSEQLRKNAITIIRMQYKREKQFTFYSLLLFFFS